MIMVIVIIIQRYNLLMVCNEFIVFNVLIDEKLVRKRIYGTKTQIAQSRTTKYVLINIRSV